MLDSILGDPDRRRNLCGIQVATRVDTIVSYDQNDCKQ